MNLLIVNYDLTDPANEDAVLKYIKSRTEWAVICDSCYVIWTASNAIEVRDALRKSAKDKIVCFVCIATLPWSSYGVPKKATDLLRKHL